MTSEFVLSYIAQHNALPEGHDWRHLVALTGLIEHQGDGRYTPTPDGWNELARLGREALEARVARVIKTAFEARVAAEPQSEEVS